MVNDFEAIAPTCVTYHSAVVVVVMYSGGHEVILGTKLNLLCAVSVSASADQENGYLPTLLNGMLHVHFSTI